MSLKKPFRCRLYDSYLTGIGVQSGASLVTWRHETSDPRADGNRSNAPGLVTFLPSFFAASRERGGALYRTHTQTRTSVPLERRNQTDDDDDVGRRDTSSPTPPTPPPLPPHRRRAAAAQLPSHQVTLHNASTLFPCLNVKAAPPMSTFFLVTSSYVI